MKKLIRKIVVLNTIVIVWFLVYLFAFNLNKVSLIVSMGLKAANFFLGLNVAAIAMLFLLGNFLVIYRGVKKLRKSKPAPPKVTVISDMENKHDPFRIRNDLSALQNGRPEFVRCLMEGITQLDNIDTKEAKLQEIRSRNEAGALKEVADSLQDAEEGICKNLSKIIDRAILIDSLEKDSPHRDSIYSENLNRMRSILDLNAETLTLCDVLLTETINYLDEKNASGGATGEGLMAMTEAIHTLRQMSGKETQ